MKRPIYIDNATPAPSVHGAIIHLRKRGVAVYRAGDGFKVGGVVIGHDRLMRIARANLWDGRAAGRAKP